MQSTQLRNELDFVARVTRALPRLYALARNWVSDRDDATDLATEAVARAWLRRDTLRAPQAFDAWITRICRTVCRDHVRHARRIPMIALHVLSERDQLLATPDTSHAENSSREEKSDRLLNLVYTLPREQRRVVLALFIDGLSVEQVAVRYDERAATVKNTVAQVRRKLRALAREFD